MHACIISCILLCFECLLAFPYKFLRTIHVSLSVISDLMWLGKQENKCVCLNKTYLLVQTIDVRSESSSMVGVSRF